MSAPQEVTPFDESFRKLLEMLPDAMILVNSDGEIVHANSLVAALFDYDPAELIGQKVECLIPEGVRVAHRQHRQGYFDGPWRRPMGVGLELSGRRKDGVTFPAEISLSPVMLDVGVHVLAAVRDIALRIEVRQELMATRGELDKAEMELEVAREIQEGLLPDAGPELPGFDIAGVSFPAFKAGGDYFGYQFLPDRRLALAIGDVTGHGVGAALLAAATHAYMRALTQNDNDVAEILPKLNRLLLADTGSRRFVTFFLGVLDWDARSFSYASAGHTPGYIMDADGVVKETLGSTGLPLGVFDACEFDVFRPIDLVAGDMICIFTDGVVEAMDADDQLFGAGRVIDLMRTHRDQPARLVAELLIAEAGKFSVGPMLDDATVAVVRAL